MQDLFAGLWLADSVGAFLTYGGPGAVYYHSPIQPERLRPGCHGWSTYGNFVANEKLEVQATHFSVFRQPIAESGLGEAWRGEARTLSQRKPT